MAHKGRPPTGEVRRYLRADGTTTFSLRVVAYGERQNLPLGNERDGWNERRAGIELGNVLAQIGAGIWKPPPKRGEFPDQPPTFHEYASMWLKRRAVEGIKDNTRKDYLWQLSNHLLPFLGPYCLDEIGLSLVEQFKDAKLDERARIAAAKERGIRLRAGDGRVLRPLSNTSINKFLILLTRILETARKRGWIDDNPASHVERLKIRRRKGAILEADELESLITAADPTPRGAAQTPARRAEVRRLRDDERLSWREIAVALGIASSTAVYLYRSVPAAPKSDGRRALIATLGCAGLRATEAAQLNVGDVDLAHAKLFVRDSKTEAGVREVDLSPRLVRELAAYLATRSGASPTEPAFPTLTGCRRDKDNIRNRVVTPIVASEHALPMSWTLPSLPVFVR